MSKRMRSVVVGLLFGVLGLFSCNDKNPTASGHSDGLAGFGKAIVKLPDLSSASLKKTVNGIAADALTLLIVANDMDTMKYSWPVYTLKGQSVQIDGIRAGENRYFEGFLTNSSGVITHTGKVAVRIIAGEVVPVYLKLSGVGSADVCIEIDGYPSSCNSNDSLYINTCLRGYDPDATMEGMIQLTVYGSVANGEFILVDGGAYKDRYLFNHPFEISVSEGNKYCRTVVLNTTTGSSHGFSMTVNENSEITDAFLSIDSSLMNYPKAQFYSVACPDGSVKDVYTCLSGYTPEDTLTGNIQLKIYSGKPSGMFTLISAKDKSTYHFNRPFNKIEGKNYQTVVLNMKTGKSHGLMMTINENDQVTYGYLSIDSNVNNKAMAKFFSSTCPISLDTLNYVVKFRGSFLPPDTLTFTADMEASVVDGMAVGNMYFYNVPGITKNPVFVSGRARILDRNTGTIEFIVTNVPLLQKITITIHDGYYQGEIFNEDGREIAFMFDR